MKQVLQHVRSRKLEVAEVPAPALRAGGILVRNVASLISAGTEKSVVDFASRSMLGKARERPDLVKQTVDKLKRDGIGPTMRAVGARLDQPIPLGYSCAGVVTEAGARVGEFAAGDRVACAGMGYAAHAEMIYVPRNLAVKIPDGVSFNDAAYVTVGAIALHGVRTADVRVGDNVLVIGLGLLGQLTVQILKAAGCRVLGLDTSDVRVQQAASTADAAINRSADVASVVAEFTGGVGVDAVIITAAADSNDPVELAGEVARDRAIVSVVGAVGMQIPRKPYYEKELDLRISRSYGPGRYDPQYEEQGHDYPIGYVRWTERRNMQEFLRLVATGAVRPAGLTTHEFQIDDALEAYELITGAGSDPFTGVMLTYPAESTPLSKTVRLAPHVTGNNAIALGCIGAGGFARSVLFPAFEADPSFRMATVCTTTGATATSAGRRFKFERATTDPAGVLADPDVHAVVITTRHDSHADLAVRALGAGKAVFVEKPLALNEEQLARVVEQASAGGLLCVGFNRRFSPTAERLRALIGDHTSAITYRINAGAVPADSWIRDPQLGGGRIIGEVCHFVDLIHYLTGEWVTDVHAIAAAATDTLTVNLRLERGSIAALSYFANGDRAFPKERVEVFTQGAVGVLDDFRTLEITRNGKREKHGRWKQDKGFAAEVAAFAKAVRGEAGAPISLESLVHTTRVTFAIETSISTGEPVRVER